MENKITINQIVSNCFLKTLIISSSYWKTNFIGKDQINEALNQYGNEIIKAIIPLKKYEIELHI